MNIIFSEFHLTISYLEQHQILQLIWSNYASSEQYREGLNLGLHLTHEKKIKYWISDLSEMAPVPAKDVEWTTQIWLPAFQKTPVERLAIVNPDHVQTLHNVNQICLSHNAGPGFRCAYFNSLTEAQAWIQQEINFATFPV